MKEIFNNLAFRSTLVYLSITKRHFWLFSQNQRTKIFLFVSETLSLKVEFVMQSASLSVPHTFFHSSQLLCLFHINIVFFAVSFPYFSEYLVELIISFEVLES